MRSTLAISLRGIYYALLTAAFWLTSVQAQAWQEVPAGAVVAPAQPGGRAARGQPQPQPGQPGAPESKPGETPAAGAKPDEKEKPAESIKTTPRPQTPATPPDPEELKVRPDESGRVRFNFQGQPWLGVLEWLAAISNLSLDWQDVPADYLNLHTQRSYTLDEARDLINRHLLDRGFTLLKHGEILSVANIKKLNPSLVPRVRPADLDDALPHEFVRVLFPLDWLKAETAVEELKPLLSPQGKLTGLKSTNRIEGIDAAANLRAIRDLLSDEQSHQGRERLVRPFKLLYVRAADVQKQLYDLLGIEKPGTPAAPMTPEQQQRMQQQMAMQAQQQQPGQKGQQSGKPEPPQVHIVVNAKENTLLANAPADQMAIIAAAVEMLDVPSDGAASLLRNPGRMQPYRPVGVDPELLVKMLEEVGNLDPTTRLQVDKKNQIIVADASLADHLTIRRLLDNLDGTDREFEVIRLRRLEAEYVAGTIEFMMGPGEKKQQQRNPYMYDPYGMMMSRGQQQEDESKKFRVDADVENNRLLLYCNEVERGEIHNLLVKLGELPGGGSGSTMRVLDTIDPAEADELLRRLQKTWPGVAPNPLRIAPGTQDDAEPAADAPPGRRAPVRPAQPKKPAPAAAAYHRGEPIGAAAPRNFVNPDALRLVQLEQSPASDDENADEVLPDDEADDVLSTEDPQSQQAPRQPQSAGGAATPQAAAPIRIGRGPDGRLVIASEDPEALDRFEDLVSQLAPPRKDYRVFKMRYKTTWPSIVAGNLEDFFQVKDQKKSSNPYTYDPYWGRVMNTNTPDEARRLSKKRPLRFIPDFDSNSILVMGADANQMRIIEELIDLYDVPESSDPQAIRLTRIVAVKHSKARVIADAVKEVYRDLLSVNDPAMQNNNQNKDQKPAQAPYTYVYNYGGGDDKKPEMPVRFKGMLSIGVDELSNTLVISSSEGLLKNVEATVKALDEAAKPTVPRVRVLQVGRQIDSSELQKRLSKLVTKPQQPPQQPGQPQQPQQPQQNEQGQSRTIIRNYE